MPPASRRRRSRRGPDPGTRRRVEELNPDPPEGASGARRPTPDREFYSAHRLDRRLPAPAALLVVRPAPQRGPDRGLQPPTADAVLPGLRAAARLRAGPVGVIALPPRQFACPWCHARGPVAAFLRVPDDGRHA